MPFLSEFTDNKQLLMRVLLSDQQLMDMVSGIKDYPVPALDLRYNRVYPVGWIDDTVSDAKTFLCFDADVASVSTIAVKNCYIYFWIFTHKSLVFTKEGVLVDRIANRVDEIINGSTELGFGKVKLETVTRWSPNTDYYGRVIKYYVQDWNRFGAKL